MKECDGFSRRCFAGSECEQDLNVPQFELLVSHGLTNVIQLSVHGTVVKDQKQVAEVLVDYFATIADGIGGNSAQLK